MFITLLLDRAGCLGEAGLVGAAVHVAMTVTALLVVGVTVRFVPLGSLIPLGAGCPRYVDGCLFQDDGSPEVHGELESRLVKLTR